MVMNKLMKIKGLLSLVLPMLFAVAYNTSLHSAATATAPATPALSASLDKWTDWFTSLKNDANGFVPVSAFKNLTTSVILQIQAANPTGYTAKSNEIKGKIKAAITNLYVVTGLGAGTGGLIPHANLVTGFNNITDSNSGLIAVLKGIIATYSK